MRIGHLDLLGPRCVVCRAQGRQSRLELASTIRTAGEDVLEGILACPEAGCRREYPIIDGIPLLVADLRAYVQTHLLPLIARRDLSPVTESLLGDCCGPGSSYDTVRQRTGIYAWDHYGDLDPAETDDPPPGAVLQLLATALDLVGATPAGPVLDLGCSVGRSTLELGARLGRPTVGIDLDFGMLRIASGALRAGEVRYDRRRVGLVYDARTVSVPSPGSELVDFWACDVSALPFPDDTFALATSLNVLDCVADPFASLTSLATVLRPGGRAAMTTPFDWSTAATPLEGWLGGHSQRGAHRGASEPVLRSLLDGTHPAAPAGLALVAERDSVPWRVRLHDRASVAYRSYLAVVEAT